MRILPLLVVLTIPITAQTTEQMLSACKDISEAKIDQDAGPIFSSNFETGQCWGTFRTLLWLGKMMDIETGQRGFIAACVPKDATTTQAIAVFTTFAKKHPELYNEPAALVGLKAFWEAFPCKDWKAKPTIHR